MGLASKLRTLLNKANETTGKGDVTLTNAIDSLVEGFGGGSFKWGGTNPRLLSTFEHTYRLADTSFEIGSSASTAAAVIRAAETNAFNPGSFIFDGNDIIIVQTITATPTHSSSANKKAQQIKFASKKVNYVTMDKAVNGTLSFNLQNLTTTVYFNQYYNSSSAVTRVKNQYGFYSTPNAENLSYGNKNINITINSPVLYYRVNSSYESSANIKLVTECEYNWKVEIYSVDYTTSPLGEIYKDIDDILRSA